jgi:hypothetical protein
VNFNFALMIESLVAFLLLVTIGYCVILNHRLKRLKADERSLKATISELITATEIAGRAVSGLKATAQECDGTLGERMRASERLAAGMERQLKAGELLLSELIRCGITPHAEPAPPPATFAEANSSAPKASDPRPSDLRSYQPKSPDAMAVVAAARAFADRARGRAREQAAGLAA